MTRPSATSDPQPPDSATSARMRGQARHGTKPELALRRELHSRGWRYYVDRAPLPSNRRRRADLVFPRLEVAVFVDGCFWHRCPQHATTPATNTAWWAAKLDANVERDRDTDRSLLEAGWTVCRIWEHQDHQQAADEVEQALRRAVEQKRPHPPGR